MKPNLRIVGGLDIEGKPTPAPILSAKQQAEALRLKARHFLRVADLLDPFGAGCTAANTPEPTIYDGLNIGAPSDGGLEPRRIRPGCAETDGDCA